MSTEHLEARSTRKRVVCRFLRGYDKWNAGEVAGFAPAFAAKLLGRGIVEKLADGEVGVKANLAAPKMPLETDSKGNTPPVKPTAPVEVQAQVDATQTAIDSAVKYQDMQVAALRTECEARGIQFDAKATRAQLIELLTGADAAQAGANG